MSKGTMRTDGLTVGIDLGDQWSHYCVLDGEGEVQARGSFKSSKDELGRQFGDWEVARFVLEVGTHSPWVSRMFEQAGHEVLVANPRQVALIAQGNRKSDEVDAELLARLGRADPELLSPVEHGSLEAQTDYALIKARDGLVRSRSDLINQARGLTKAIGVRLPSCSASAFHKKVAESVPTELAPALLPLLEVIGELSETIREYDEEIDRLADEKYGASRLLRQVKGVGSLTALAYMLSIQNPRRFSRSRDVGAYFGLVPRRRDSGSSSPELGITKAGDGLVRRLLVQSAHYILGPFGEDSDLRRWGLKLAERGDKVSKKKAVIAVARKLAVLLHRLWVTGEVYEPLRVSKRREREKAA